MPLKRRPDDHNGNNENKRPRNIGQSPLTFFNEYPHADDSSISGEPVTSFSRTGKEDSLLTLSESGQSNDLLSVTDKAAEQMHSQDAKVYREIEGSRKSARSPVLTAVSLLCPVIYEDEPLLDGSTTRGLVKSPTYNASGCTFGERSSSLCDLSVTQKASQPSLNILANEDTGSSKKNTQIPCEEDDPSNDKDDYDELGWYLGELKLSR